MKPTQRKQLNLTDTHSTDQELHLKLGQLVLREREVLVEVVTCIYEMNRKKSFARLGFGSMFAYLTQVHKYSAGSAQRRIEAARLLGGTSEMESLRTGELTLKSISTVAVALREKQKSTGEKISKPDVLALIEQVRGLPESKAEQLVAEKLSLTVRTQEKTKAQGDGSVRVEFTLTAEENALIEEAKRRLSHAHPHLGTKDLLVVLSRKLMKKSQERAKADAKSSAKASARASAQVNDVPTFTDETRFSGVSTVAPVSVAPISAEPEDAKSISTVEIAAVKVASTSEAATPTVPNPVAPTATLAIPTPTPPNRVTAKIREAIIARDRHCQWPNPTTGGVCGSQHQLQVDHIHAKWLGGGDGLENLQTLCAQHNKEKYKRECQAWDPLIANSSCALGAAIDTYYLPDRPMNS